MALKDYSGNEAVRSKGQDLVSTVRVSTNKMHLLPDRYTDEQVLEGFWGASSSDIKKRIYIYHTTAPSAPAHTSCCAAV